MEKVEAVTKQEANQGKTDLEEIIQDREERYVFNVDEIDLF